MSQFKANERINQQMTVQKKSKKPVIILGVIAFLFVTILLLFLFLWTDKEKDNLVVTRDNVDEVIAQMDASDRTPIGSYEVVMNTAWTFPDSSSVSSNAYVENSVNNRNAVFFTITPEEDSANVIYTSPDIPIGGKLQNIKLEKPLEKGTHNMLLKYHLLDDNGKETQSVTVKLKVTIQK